MYLCFYFQIPTGMLCDSNLTSTSPFLTGTSPLGMYHRPLNEVLENWIRKSQAWLGEEEVVQDPNSDGFPGRTKSQGILTSFEVDNHCQALQCYSLHSSFYLAFFPLRIKQIYLKKLTIIECNGNLCFRAI